LAYPIEDRSLQENHVEDRDDKQWAARNYIATQLFGRNSRTEAEVKVDTQQLRKQYASMTDEALIELDPVDLTPDAQESLNEELARRGLEEDLEEVALPGERPEPKWLDGGFCVSTFTANISSDAAPQAAEACDALRAAGIESYILPYEFRGKLWVNPTREFRVMVPGGKMLEATSVLDQKIFNPEIADDWRVHLETMSDEDFATIDRDVICAGFLDRAARLKQAYDDEHARRFPPDDQE
jgi:hypothetical protein